MPGTILVSVLEFLGLPFSSSPSTISIKVSMGKKEYQAWEKGEFSFPLTTLRETLVVVVQDEEGNEISYAGVETKSIVEKGLWDDIFPLEGGGKVHMKLQFVLNEDEKNRVRVMRESAMKKKQTSLERGSNIASSLYRDNADKTEESPSSAVSLPQRVDFDTSQVNLEEPVEKVETRSPSDDTPTKVVLSEESSSSIRSSELESSSTKQASVEDEESPSSAFTSPQTANVNTSQVNLKESVEKVEAQSISADTPTNAVYSRESSSSITSPESGSFSKKQASMETEESPSSPIPSAQRADFNTNQVNRREPVEKVEVRSLSDTPTKVIDNSKQSSYWIRSSESGSSLKKRPSMERTPSSVKRMISAFESNLSQDIRPQVKPTPERREVNKMGQEFGTQASGKFAELSTKKVIGKGTDISPNSKLKLTQKEPDKDQPDEDLMRKPTIRTSLAADNRLYELQQQSSDNVGRAKVDSGDNAVNVEETQAENSLTSPQSSTTPRTSTCKSTTVDLEDLYEISGSWIFPDHHQRFCLTTSGKKVTDFLEGQSVKKSFSTSQKENNDGDNQSEAKRSNKAFETEKSQPESENVEPSRGLIEQVIKVAIMVGFGLLVLLTRRRTNR